MKKILACLMVSFLALTAYQAHAQKDDKKFSFGLGLDAGMVTGDFDQIYSLATGLNIRGSYKVGPGFATLTTGFLACLPKDLDGEDLKAGILVPIKAGYKFIFQDRFFVMGELGYGSFNYYFENYNGEIDSENLGGFMYAPSIGVQFGKFELALRYEGTDLEGGSLSTALLRVGVNF